MCISCTIIFFDLLITSCSSIVGEYIIDNQLDDYNAILDMDVLTEGKSDNEAQVFPREEGAITK